MSKNTSIYVRIGEAKNLPGKDISGKSDPYCVVKIDNEIVARTATVYRDLEPFWGEEYTMFVPGGFTNLSVYVYDEDTIGDDDRIGKVTFDREVLSHSPKGVDKWSPLSPAYNEAEVQGEICMEVTLHEKGSLKKIKVRILEARDLSEKALSGVQCTNPYIRLSLRGENFVQQTYNQHHRTNDKINDIFKDSCAVQLKQDETEKKDIKKTRKTSIPKGQKVFEFDSTEPLQQLKLVAELYDWNTSGQNLFMGQATVFLTGLKSGETKTAWYKLFPNPGEITRSESKNLGSIRLKIRVMEERILPYKNYETLINLLMDSVSSPSGNGITVLNVIEDMQTIDRNELARQMVRLFLGEQVVIPFLDTLMMREISNTTNPSTLFRGNSLATKAMEQFMKVVGIPYLKDVLKPVIDKIFEEKKFVELDPSKSEIRPNRFRRLSLKPVDELIDKSVVTLQGYLDLTMNSVLSSTNDCPPHMRAAFRNLNRRVSDQFNTLEYEDINYQAISGFLFLRFLAPAILGPKLFSLRDHHADKIISRTLTLLAKAVQKIGNLDKEVSRGKEEWMAPLAPSIAKYTEQVKDFLDRLMDVEDNQIPRCDHRRSLFHQSLVIKEGYLKKCHCNAVWIPKPFSFKKRYCWLSTENLLYGRTVESETRLFLPTTKILAVERVDENAFQKPNVLQIISGDSIGAFTILYLAAQDVNEMNQWLSAIRKTTLSNAQVLASFHPGIFNRGKWTCCKQAQKTVVGCSQTHTNVTISDWRDPLDPDSETQTIFSHLLMCRDELVKKIKDCHKNNNGSQVTLCDVIKSENQGQDGSYLVTASKLLRAIDEIDELHKLYEKSEEFMSNK